MTYKQSLCTIPYYVIFIKYNLLAQNAENLPPETSLVYLGMRKKITGRFQAMMS